MLLAMLSTSIRFFSSTFLFKQQRGKSYFATGTHESVQHIAVFEYIVCKSAQHMVSLSVCVSVQNSVFENICAQAFIEHVKSNVHE